LTGDEIPQSDLAQAISFGGICQLPAVRVGNVIAESRAVSIYPWQIRSARGRGKPRIAAALGIGKVIS